MRFVLRVDRMGGKVEVRGLAVGDEKIYRFERVVRDVVRSAGLPVRIDVKEKVEDRSGLVEKLRGVFVSEEAVSGTFSPPMLLVAVQKMLTQSFSSALLFDLKVNIIQRLIPKLQIEGYVETATSADDEAESTARHERRAQEARDLLPGADPGNVPRPPAFQPLPDLARPRPHPAPDFPPPDFEDPYEMNRPGVRHPLAPNRSPYNIGHDDLNPQGLGPHDPFRGSLVGGGLPRPGGGAGMHPTFDDPLFGGQGGASGGYDPQAPPGARWDPLGPGGGPRHGPGSGGGHNPFGGFGGGDII